MHVCAYMHECVGEWGGIQMRIGIGIFGNVIIHKYFLSPTYRTHNIQSDQERERAYMQEQYTSTCMHERVYGVPYVSMCMHACSVCVNLRLSFCVCVHAIIYVCTCARPCVSLCPYSCAKMR